MRSASASGPSSTSSTGPGRRACSRGQRDELRPPVAARRQPRVVVEPHLPPLIKPSPRSASAPPGSGTRPRATVCRSARAAPRPPGRHPAGPRGDRRRGHVDDPLAALTGASRHESLLDAPQRDVGLERGELAIQRHRGSPVDGELVDRDDQRNDRDLGQSSRGGPRPRAAGKVVVVGPRLAARLTDGVAASTPAQWVSRRRFYGECPGPAHPPASTRRASTRRSSPSRWTHGNR